MKAPCTMATDWTPLELHLSKSGASSQDARDTGLSAPGSTSQGVEPNRVLPASLAKFDVIPRLLACSRLTSSASIMIKGLLLSEDDKRCLMHH